MRDGLAGFSNPWYDPLGLLTAPTGRIGRAAPNQSAFLQPTHQSVRQATDVSIQRAPDHDAVVATAIANAAKRLNSLSAANNRQSEQTEFSVQPVAWSEQTGKTSGEIVPASYQQKSTERTSANGSVGIPPASASPDLHKPWNLDEFPLRRNGSTGSYRLVSDTQSASARTSPPKANLNQLVASPAPASKSSSVATPTASATTKATTKATVVQPKRERMPLLGIGRDFMNELRPSNERTWSQNHAVLQTAEFHGNLATVRNIRYSKYRSREEYSTVYYDATFNLDDIRTFDLVIVPFHAMPSLAHVQASFGFADGRHIALSIEARYEEGEQYDPVAAAMRQFELIYVFADERDLVRIGTDVNQNDVHIYRLKLEPSEVREIFVDALQRANSLAKKPEFYHPLRNSCVTNLMDHVNKGRPKAIPREYRTLLPGLMDHYVYDLGLVDTTAKNFKEAKENAKVNWLVEKYGDLEYFSSGIRQNMY